MLRQELMVMSHEPVGVAKSMPDNGADRQMYGQQSNCIASVADLDQQLGQLQLEKPRDQQTWDSDEVGVEAGTPNRTVVPGSMPITPAATDEGANKYAFLETTPPDTVDKTVVNAEPAVHERVQNNVHEIVQEITRDIHHYDEHYRIQPVLDLKVLPTRHIFIDSQGHASELHFEGGKPPPGFEFGRPF
ncbi:uncharacterized protein B0I36DRAFT_337286 [Microdochium trichocladiopsis]|uniref:Uncharacterized protein n=1 Tax=Microdochium trichocladiopsis TaxID=1682393 RepID=A0A9P8XT59_9PEZI|nr:uncharacterized protein B0I36DRAFT_337286 [Microdochium trichocladiopsis]KAH7016307.1 hypothetical protein B0I36DRAFT_337286 [Microdochium trichocladiopsis]